MINNRNRFSKVSYPPDGFQETVTTRRVTPREIAYRDGYVRGRIQERDRRHDVERIYHNPRRDRQKIAVGVLLGVLLSSVVGLLIVVLVSLAENQQTRPSIAPAPSPVAPAQMQNSANGSQNQS